MPFSPSDADKHKKGLTDQQKKQWAAIANSVLEACIADGGTTETCDAKAIIQANGAVGKAMNLTMSTASAESFKRKWNRKTMSLNFKPITKTAKQRYTLGVVYEPNVLDTQGDFATAEVIEKSAWDFMRSLQGNVPIAGGVMRIVNSVARAVTSGREIKFEVDTDDPMTEVVGHVLSYLKGFHDAPVDPLTLERVAKLVEDNSPLGDMHATWDAAFGDIVESYCAPTDFILGDEKISKGTWLLGVVWSEEMFQKIESGERNGLSLGAWAVTVEVDDAP